MNLTDIAVDIATVSFLLCASSQDSLFSEIFYSGFVDSGDFGLAFRPSSPGRSFSCVSALQQGNWAMDQFCFLLYIFHIFFGKFCRKAGKRYFIHYSYCGDHAYDADSPWPGYYCGTGSFYAESAVVVGTASG